MPVEDQQQDTPTETKELTLTEAVEESIAGMDWLTPADKATVTLARKYAKALDKILNDPTANPGDVTKALYMGPHLLKALETLGGTPEARKKMQGKQEEEKPKNPVESSLNKFEDRKKARQSKTK